MVIRIAPSLAMQVYRAILDEVCDAELASGAHLVQERPGNGSGSPASRCGRRWRCCGPMAWWRRRVTRA